MRILYITSVLGERGGSELYARDLILQLRKRGHQLLVCTTEEAELEGVEMLRIPAFLHHGLHKFTAPLFYRRVVKAALKFKPDIIQSHSNCFMGWIGDRVKKKMNVPHVLLIELITDKNKNIHTKAIYWSERFLLPRLGFDKLVVWTENIRQRFLFPWGIKEERTAVIPAGLNIGNYNPTQSGKWARKKFGKNLITSIKTLWTTNALGLRYVIKAMKTVVQKHPEWKYVIFGEGNSRQSLVQLVKRLGLEKNVLLPGSISEEEKRAVWAATEIAPHSFVYEFSTSISLLEYMAMGKACVVTDVGAVKEFVGDTVLVVKPESQAQIARGINSLIENRALRKSLAKKARKLVEEKYSIKASVGRLEKMYAGLLKK